MADLGSTSSQKEILMWLIWVVVQRRSLMGLVSELRSCVNVEVDALGSLSLIVLMVSVDVKEP